MRRKHEMRKKYSKNVGNSIKHKEKIRFLNFDPFPSNSATLTPPPLPIQFCYPDWFRPTWGIHCGCWWPRNLVNNTTRPTWKQLASVVFILLNVLRPPFCTVPVKLWWWWMRLSWKKSQKTRLKGPGRGWNPYPGAPPTTGPPVQRLFLGYL